MPQPTKYGVTGMSHPAFGKALLFAALCMKLLDLSYGTVSWHFGSYMCAREYFNPIISGQVDPSLDMEPGLLTIRKGQICIFGGLLFPVH